MTAPKASLTRKRSAVRARQRPRRKPLHNRGFNVLVGPVASARMKISPQIVRAIARNRSNRRSAICNSSSLREAFRRCEHELGWVGERLHAVWSLVPRFQGPSRINLVAISDNVPAMTNPASRRLRSAPCPRCGERHQRRNPDTVILSCGACGRKVSIILTGRGPDLAQDFGGLIDALVRRPIGDADGFTPES